MDIPPLLLGGHLEGYVKNLVPLLIGCRCRWEPKNSGFGKRNHNLRTNTMVPKLFFGPKALYPYIAKSAIHLRSNLSCHALHHHVKAPRPKLLGSSRDKRGKLLRAGSTHYPRAKARWPPLFEYLWCDTAAFVSI